MEPRLKIQMF